ncbi:MAG: carboxymuconolactone decarboxylase family protein [Candidatus Binataceae bacterium]
MARLPYLNRGDLLEADREIFDRQAAERGGPVGNLFRVLAHAPNLMQRFLKLGNHLRNHTQLDAKLRELALLTVGRLAGAEYELVHHWNLARRVGVPREQLEHLAEFETSTLFDDRERAVMRYAAQATVQVKVSDAAFDAIRSFLDNRRIMELVMNVAYYNMVVRILVPTGVELEPGVVKR